MINSNLTEIVRRLVQGLQPEQIILFGSYAYGQPTEQSDFDIMVIIAESTESPHRRVQKAYRCLRGIKVPIDLIVLTLAELTRQSAVVTSLGRQVLETGKILYERGKTHRDSGMVSQEPT